MIVVIRIYLLKEISVSNTVADEAAANNSNKKVIFKIFSPLTV